MKNSELQQILKSITSPQWRHSILRGHNGGLLRWLPVIKIDGDTWYGLSEDGRWVAGSEDENVRLVEISGHEPAVPLLACLEHSRSEIESLVAAGCQFVGLPAAVVDTFPFEAGVTCGLMSSSDYWIGLAIEWLQDMPINDKMAKILSGVVKSKGVSQKNRHRAAQLFKQLISKHREENGHAHSS